MGSYKFRLSDMIPNAWFYKLKDMSKTRNQKSHRGTAAAPRPMSPKRRQPPTPDPSDQRKSYHFTRDHKFHGNSPTKYTAVNYSEPPRVSSSKKRRSTKKNRVSAGYTCRVTLEPYRNPPDSTSEEFRDSTSCKCKFQNDIIIDLDEKPFHAKSEVDLPPIITKLSDTDNHIKISEKFEERNAYESLSVMKTVKDDTLSTDSKSKQQRTTSFRKSTVHSPGMKIRHRNSPRIGRTNFPGRKSVSSSSSSSSWKSASENFAVVKSSQDPQRDFRESMVEMIVENNIRASKDLEELLACYLSLNSDEYHDLIIKVFKQIWFDIIADIRMK
ncbi:transcription repressor OFP1-like [Olea europaea subsp. europaea]|uniref:Transcription repressor n=1 Tax=Olea europaea subsp. europaea TaxID=158383 RepID=A0A8S0VNH3_OLEEU|nr:transcription repressor OFP1-like [Olea europaea subsp. europaea]